MIGPSSIRVHPITSVIVCFMTVSGGLERCPDCGRVPPGRKKVKQPDKVKKLMEQKMTKKRVSGGGSSR